MGFDLNQTNAHLFVEVDDVFKKDKGEGKLDKNEYMLDMTNSSNPVLRIGDVERPVDENILIKNGVTHELEGIIVYALVTGKVYIPTEAITMVNC
jgi:alkaline phosphatase